MLVHWLALPLGRDHETVDMLLVGYDAVPMTGGGRLSELPPRLLQFD
jgi:hypothetical protein